MIDQSATRADIKTEREAGTKRAKRKKSSGKRSGAPLGVLLMSALVHISDAGVAHLSAECRFRTAKLSLNFNITVWRYDLGRQKGKLGPLLSPAVSG